MNTAGNNVKRTDENNERNVITDQSVCECFDRSLCSKEHKERNGCQNCPHQGDFAVVFVPEMCKKQRSQGNTEQNTSERNRPAQAQFGTGKRRMGRNRKQAG